MKYFLNLSAVLMTTSMLLACANFSQEPEINPDSFFMDLALCNRSEPSSNAEPPLEATTKPIPGFADLPEDNNKASISNNRSSKSMEFIGFCAWKEKQTPRIAAKSRATNAQLSYPKNACDYWNLCVTVRLCMYQLNPAKNNLVTIKVGNGDPTVDVFNAGKLKNMNQNDTLKNAIAKVVPIEKPRKNGTVFDTKTGLYYQKYRARYRIFYMKEKRAFKSKLSADEYLQNFYLAMLLTEYNKLAKSDSSNANLPAILKAKTKLRKVFDEATQEKRDILLAETLHKINVDNLTATKGQLFGSFVLTVNYAANGKMSVTAKLDKKGLIKEKEIFNVKGRKISADYYLGHYLSRNFTIKKVDGNDNIYAPKACDFIE